MKNFAVFASGRGTNLQAIINASQKGKIKAHLKLVISDNKKAYALRRAEKARIKTLVVDPKDFPDRKSFDREMVRQLKEEKIDFVVLAGFMRLLSSYFIREYRNKILNIHPALLPTFKGTHAIQDAFSYGVKVTGVTIHFVDEKIDHGPIILQESLKVSAAESLARLEERIHRLEHRLYPKAIELFARGRLRIKGRKVKIV